ncbi:MAG: hydrogenase expression/formation protein HypC [Gaiellales bacterium]|nr:hydrogenase expression/formation protein HypC [Gaiellales bacterium]
MEFVDEPNRLARVDVAGVIRTVNVGLLDRDGDAAVAGDWVLIHVGFALSKVDEDEAAATLRMLQGMGADYEQELAELRASVIE